MKILAIDTAAQSCSVAVSDHEELLGEMTLNLRQTHSRHLLAMIHQVLSDVRLSVSDLDGFGVVRGPGSFTGLRIGISTVKGLCAATGKPLAGVSSLDALAFPFAFYEGTVCALLDARKGEVYGESYRCEDGKIEKYGREGVMRPEQVPEILLPEILQRESESAGRSEEKDSCLFVGTGARLYREIIRNLLDSKALFSSPQDDLIRAAAVARIAFRRLIEKDADDVVSFTPHYIRKSDAQIHLQKRTL